jgi:L-fuculose-phosphate aldolase
MTARLRREIVATLRRLEAAGLYTGSSGNVSARTRGGFLITPTGIPCDETRPSQIVAMTMAGKRAGLLLPSSEWRFHRDIYRERPEVNAVIHTHSPYAAALSCLRKDVPSFHYMVAKAGGDTIRCSRYATFGTEALSKYALAALRDRRACLLANHGMIAVGADLAAARRLAVEVEDLCGQYWRALLAGKPVLLPKGEMARVVMKFKTYGKQPRIGRRGR